MNVHAANELLAKVWRDIQQASARDVQEKAKASPYAYRDTTVMKRGKDTQYRFYNADAGACRKGQKVRFCYSIHRNVAGYYLSWIEVSTKDRMQRFNIRGSATKREAIGGCVERLRDSRKPKADRRFTIPAIAKATGGAS